jgi:hypothetical protein
VTNFLESQQYPVHVWRLWHRFSEVQILHEYVSATHKISLALPQLMPTRDMISSHTGVGFLVVATYTSRLLNEKLMFVMCVVGLKISRHAKIPVPSLLHTARRNKPAKTTAIHRIIPQRTSSTHHPQQNTTRCPIPTIR